MIREKIPTIGRIGSLLVLIIAVVVILTAFIRARRNPPPPDFKPGPPMLSHNVISIIESYKYIETDKNGREKFRMLAAKDIAYDDGRHEMEKVDLTNNLQQGKSLRVVSDRGVYLQHDKGQLTFTGNVKVTSSEGLELTTESLTYEQQSAIAHTDFPVRFHQGESSGSSIGATLRSKDHVLTLPKSAHIVNSDPAPKKEGGVPPIEVNGDSAEYVEKDGTVKFLGNVNASQGDRHGRADLATGFINPQTKRLERIELRGHSWLESLEKGKASEVQSRDMDIFFDEERRLKSSSAYGEAHAQSLEPDAPREISAERIDITYKPTETGSDIQLVNAQGRAMMKLAAVLSSAKEGDWSERVIEADTLQAAFRDDGKNLARADAIGNAVLTVTPKRFLSPRADKKTLRAPKFTADFYETGNVLKTFVAEPNPVAEFDPILPDGKEFKGKDASGKGMKKIMTGKKMTANFNQQTQEVNDVTVDGDARFSQGDRVATAARGVYTSSNQTMAMRGKPQIWDSSMRASADFIDTNVEASESELRGNTHTTYYNRDSTGGATPFKNVTQPVTIASDHATIKHNEGAARYIGNARAWQGDDFVRAENIELDKGEREMTAWDNAQSAFYDFEREGEKGHREIVPVFASSDRIIYKDAIRTAHYEGGVKIRQGTDHIDSASADAVLNEENNLVSLTATKDVVITQPTRRATGDRVVYTASTDTAVLTGNNAIAEDHTSETVTKSRKLIFHLRDARIEANDDSSVDNGVRKRVRTTHRIQN